MVDRRRPHDRGAHHARRLEVASFSQQPPCKAVAPDGEAPTLVGMRVRFPAYRRYTAARVEVNDAAMALLVGARLGEHALKTSAADPDVLLPALFGRIQSIERFNRTPADAAA